MFRAKFYLSAALCVLAFASCTHLKMGLFMFNSNPSENDPLSVVRGREAFLKSCTNCHGENADGKGSEVNLLTTAPRDFHDPEYTKSALRIANHIANGRGSEMPAFNEKLPYETIWDIANYLHSLQQPAKDS